MKLDKPLNLTFSSPAARNTAVALGGSVGEPTEQVAELKKELQARSREVEAKNQEISELKIKLRHLQSENQETRERQALMDEELRKAEAQIELIMELINENPGPDQ